MSVAINSSPAGALNSQSRWKRKASDDEDDRRGDVKRAKNSWYVTLESESSAPTDEDQESIYTVQGYETEFARDTSDTSTHSWISSSNSDVSVHVEYELDSRSENEDPFVISSSSEPENILEVEVIGFCDSEGLADDSDDSRSSIDSEIRRAAFRTCVQCKNPNNNPLFRFCEKCYQVRKTHFPRNRLRKKPRSQKDESKKSVSTTSISGHELTEMDSGIASIQCEVDSGLASSQDLDKPSTDSQCSESPLFDSQGSELTTVMFGSQSSGISTSTMYTVATSQSLERDEVDSGLAPTEFDSDDHLYSPDNGSIGLNLTKDKVDSSEAKQSSNNTESSLPLSLLSKKLQSRREENGNVTTSIPKNEIGSKQQKQGPDGLCNICIERPKNGAFVHGRTEHICFCYRCAKKVWMTNGYRCPICNRKVTQVLKAFYV